MLSNPPSPQPNTFLNPVHPWPCADPFVLKHAGAYWCYCTGQRPDGGAFGILHSTDLVHWRDLGSALALLPGGHTCYWAPEVVYDNGRFYMYYSVGNETRMTMRVAVAEQPGGPFVDSGHALTTEEFAIDGHVFVDDDGARYLFYATDFLTHTHVGTGVVVDRMHDPFHLAGAPQPVTRARYDWQVYDPQRQEKGGVRWHTVEGPYVLKRKGCYYLMFSGGNWQNVTYGVGYATSDRVLPEGEWEQAADGHKVLPILRTLPEAGVIGPGHNSVVRGPDNQQLFCIYHRWSREVNDRVLAIDRMDWVGDRLLVLGPTHTSQPAPNAPALAGFGAGPALGQGWAVAGGAWQVTEDQARQTQTEGAAAARHAVPGTAFVLEVTVALKAGGASDSAYGVGLPTGAADGWQFALRPDRHAVTITQGQHEHVTRLPEGFDFAAGHLLRVEVDGERVRASLDDRLWRWEGRATPAANVALFTHNASAAFAGLALTVGWQDDFEQTAEPAEQGWEAAGAAGAWQVTGGKLRQTQPQARGSLRVKGEALAAYELVINGCILEYGEPGPGPGGWGLYPCYAGPQDTGPLFTVEPHLDRWNLVWRPGRAPNELDKQDTVWLRGHVFPLPADFDPYTDQQFRFRLEDGQLAIQYAGQALGGIQAPGRPGRVALYTDRAAAGWEMVRVTAL